MVKVHKVIAPINGMDFDMIGSFETERYYGIWEHTNRQYIMFPKTDCELTVVFLKDCSCLSDLDDAVYDACEEHIIGVSTSQQYEFKIIEEDDWRAR